MRGSGPRSSHPADIFFVSQWADVETYTGVAFALDPAHLAGEGPCAVLDPDTMELDPARQAAFQVLVDHYFGVVEDVCADYPTCRTDGGTMQTMDLVAEDLTPDLDHLSVKGHAKMADMVFDALYGSD